jgi:preprotein translocase subunit SecG
MVVLPEPDSPISPTSAECPFVSRTAEQIHQGPRHRPTVAWPGTSVGLLVVRDAVLYVTLVINFVSMVAMVAGILMHSGRGGGLSDMFGGGGGAALGSSAAERNLNRITFVLALIWVITVIALGFLLVR